MDADIAAAPNTGATANFVCDKCLERRDSALGRWVVLRGETFCARARFGLGDVRLGDVRSAPGTSAGIVRRRREFTGLALGADIHPLL